MQSAMLALPNRQTEVASWFQASNHSSADVTAKAYANAVQFFERELAHDPKARTWIRGCTSLEDVRQVVSQAQQLYDAKSQKTAKPKKWVDQLASVLMAYSGVLDTLSQADPMHAGLIWGAMKFVLQGVLNNSKMMKDLAKALSKIGDALPRIQIEGFLYQSTWMQDAISKLYAYILLFLQNTVQWYNAGSVRRAMYSMSRPLLFDDIVTEINTCTEAIEAISSTSSRAEIRNLSVTSTASYKGIQDLAIIETDQTNRLKQSDIKLNAMQRTIQETSVRTDEIHRIILQYMTDKQDLSQPIKHDSKDFRAQICGSDSSAIISLLRPTCLPEDALRSYISFARRRASWWQPGRDTNNTVHQLRDWVQLPGSATLIVKAGPRAETRAKDMVTDVLKLLRLTSHTVFWYVPSPIKSSMKATLSDILQSVTYQALCHKPSIITQDARLAKAQAFQQQLSLTEWIDLTALVLSHVGNCFLALDAEDLCKSTQTSNGPTHALVQAFGRIVDSVSTAGGNLKLLLLVSGFASLHMAENLKIMPMVTTINAPLPAARRIVPGRSPLANGFGRGKPASRLRA